jgi:excinuclease UvrABC ATPase subunit
MRRLPDGRVTPHYDPAMVQQFIHHPQTTTSGTPGTAWTCPCCACAARQPTCCCPRWPRRCAPAARARWVVTIPGCGHATALPVRHDTPQTIYADLLARAAAAGDPRLVFTFPAELPADTSAEQQEQWLSASGFTRVQAERVEGSKKILDVVADRLPPGRRREGARAGGHRAGAQARRRAAQRVRRRRWRDAWRYSTGLHCPESDLRYADPQPALFSFNSAYGACETCRGFGRVIGVDWAW